MYLLVFVFVVWLFINVFIYVIKDLVTILYHYYTTYANYTSLPKEVDCSEQDGGCQKTASLRRWIAPSKTEVVKIKSKKWLVFLI
jgi:hypothetical protein